MSAWLDELRRALDASPRPVEFFFRDDDAGWGDGRLLELLDLFARHAAPLDLAAIPGAVSARLANELRARIEDAPDRVAVHQHGFSHANHELEGRKCEFGDARDGALQRRDIESGKGMLAELFGPLVSPIFTPPWNRCAAVTGDCLRRTGFRVLSRDATAPPLNLDGLCELPITVDWFARRRGVRLGDGELGTRLADAARKDGPVGVMFHHELMGAEERGRVGELLALLASHPNARCHLMDALSTRHQH